SPAHRIRPRPRNSCPNRVKRGWVNLAIQATSESRRMRVTRANINPVCRALACCSGGNLPARIEMKMTLSMPRTISRTVRVKRLIHASGKLIHSITGARIGEGRDSSQSLLGVSSGQDLSLEDANKRCGLALPPHPACGAVALAKARGEGGVSGQESS